MDVKGYCAAANFSLFLSLCAISQSGARDGSESMQILDIFPLSSLVVEMVRWLKMESLVARSSNSLTGTSDKVVNLISLDP